METTRMNCSASVGLDGGEFALRHAKKIDSSGIYQIRSIDSNMSCFVVFMRPVTVYLRVFFMFLIQIFRSSAVRKCFSLSSQMSKCRPRWIHRPTVLRIPEHLLHFRSFGWSSWAGKEPGRARRATPSSEEREGLRAGNPRRSA